MKESEPCVGNAVGHCFARILITFKCFLKESDLINYVGTLGVLSIN